jgi:hypothetical protein|tara:strand:+ start:1386 stop:1994 length:609 start_codon:yes stop_codon:yes gene_type:complete
MKSIFSDQLSDFSSIHLNDVELVSVSRPNFDSIEKLSLKFLETRESLNLRWIQNLETDNRLNDLSESIPSILRSMLISEIDDSSKILCEHMGCCKVEVRLATLRSPMCPLFHVDNITTRLLITLCGKGTEWIPESAVDWNIFTDRENTNLPLKNGSEIQELKVGHWSLLKGGAWDDNFNGVVHRSPHTDDARLLLSIDPVFE